MEDREKVKKSIATSFKIQAFTLKKEALELAVDKLEGFDKEKRTQWIRRLIEGLRKENLNGTVVDLESLRNVITAVSHARNDNIPILNVFDVTTVPRWDLSFDGSEMIIHKDGVENGGSVNHITMALRQRLLLVQSRISRTPQLEGCKVSPIDSLLSSAANDETVIVLGVLVRIKTDEYHIEDLTGCIPIELNDNVTFNAGVFTLGSVMMFEGQWDGVVLSVSGVALVPIEKTDDTRSVIGNLNFFGGNERTAFRVCPKLRTLAARRSDTSIVFLSDVNVDKPQTMEAIYSLLNGFSSYPPTAFVICGDFSSTPLQCHSTSNIEKGFKMIANMIKQLSSAFVSTQFIFVPGMQDTSLPHILPHPPLPSILQEPFSSLKNCTFTTNPARIQLANQEIVVFRNDTVERLCKSAIHVPEKMDELGNHISHTILSNSHLCPLPLSLQPIIPNLDHTLRIHPIPDLIVLADRFQTYITEHKGCVVSNPGPFGRLRYDFHVYFPSTRKIDLSTIELSSS